MRRATLRGLENLNKRHQIAAACYNLSQLLRRLYGIGTPKQWAACLSLLLARWLYLLSSAERSFATQLRHWTIFLSLFRRLTRMPSGYPGSSTGC